MREPHSSCRCTGTLLLLSAMLCTGASGVAQDDQPLPLILRYDAGGIDNVVKSVQWSPDGKTLYAAGWNKVVQVYRLDEAKQQFRYFPSQNFRIPADTGRSGGIEAMLVSPSGRTLIVAGSAWHGIVQQPTGFEWPRSQTEEKDWLQIGSIYVFDTVTRACRVFRGHNGAVRQLAFVENGNEPSQFVSLGFEYAGQKISQSVRLWSLETGVQVGQPLQLPHVLIPPSTDISPRIQAWQSAPMGVNVAVAGWRIEGGALASELMIWHPLQNGNPQELIGAPASLALKTTGSGTSRQLFCGGIGTATIFSIGDGQQISSQPISDTPNTSTPFAATTLPAANGTAVERLAVVSARRQASGDTEYQLSILENNRFRSVGALWVNRGGGPYPSATLIEPVISASPDGRFLSVAGSIENEIRIYRNSELLRIQQPAGERQPLQILKGKMLRPDSVAFVRNGENTGIAVATGTATDLRSVPNGNAIPAQSIVIDPTASTATTGTAGWIVNRSETGSWQTNVSPDHFQIVVTDGSPTRQVLRLPSDFRLDGFQEDVTAHAVCVEHGENPPLTVVATNIQGEPFLFAYDSQTGKCLRKLVGHERRITDLAFSADGRLLLSASLDGTVRGWMIEDLAAKTIGQVGWLPGVFAKTSNEQTVVDRIDANSPAAQAGIQRDDVIRGIIIDNQFDELKSATEFYLRISQTPTSRYKTVTLRLQRGNQTMDVNVGLDQGIDARGPLFSLLLSDPDDPQRPGDRQWLIWSPFGQFDVNGAGMERQLGWHINTKDDADPVRFSSIEQYRDRFLQKGLLRHLLGGAEVSVRKAVSPEMRISLMTAKGEILSPNYDDELVLHEPEGHLIVELDNQSGDLVQTVDWSIDDQAPHEFSVVERDVWKSRVSAEDIGRDEHRVFVRLVTNDTPPREYTKTIFLRYQPAAPKIRLESPGQSLSAVRSERLEIKAGIEVAVKTAVTVLHEFSDGNHNEFVSELNESGNLTRELVLKPGKNVIRIIAKNAVIPASVAEYAGQESASVEAVVEYAPIGPPKIFIDEILQTDPDDKESESQPAVVQEGKLQVDHARITIRGHMEGEEKMQTATLRFADKTTSLNGFKTDQEKVASFSESIQLKPGEQQLILSGSAGGKEGHLPVDILFHPTLPDISLVTPTDRDIVLDASQFDGTLPMEFKLNDTRKYPFQYQVFVDDQPITPSVISFDTESGLLSGKLPLRVDASRADDVQHVEIRLTNEWGRSAGLGLNVRFKHPPKVLSVDVRRKDGSALADVVCHVESSMSRSVSSVGLRVNGNEIHAVSFDRAKVENGIQDITISGVALIEGPNTIEIDTSNSDGKSNSVVVKEIVLPVPKTADIRLIRPLISGTSSKPVQLISFLVKSEPGLERVDLVVERDYRTPQRIPLLDKDKLKNPEADHAFVEQRFDHLLPLTTGSNRIFIEVQNRGGVTAQRFAVTYLPPPVSISVEKLVTVAATSPIRSADDSQNRPAFESNVDLGETILVGKIEWIAGHRPAGANWTVRVWVNGFLKTLKVKAPAEGIEKVEFQVPLVLNLPNNRIRLEAPEITASQQKLAIEDHSMAALQNIIVACRKPEQRQRLHLVLMGVEMEHGRNLCRAEDLTQAANAALRLNTAETAFATIRSYSPLVGEKAIGRNLKTMMVMIETQIAQQRLTSGVNDVVMFYYRGREYRATDGKFVLEDFQNFENPLAHPQSISESYLAGLFEHLPGAHVVFLDIENPQNADPAAMQWPRYPNLGVFRVAWSGKKPVPKPPGPIFSTLEEATNVATTKETASLGGFERLLHMELQSSKFDRRFILETFVPDDMLELVLARFPSAPISNN